MCEPTNSRLFGAAKQIGLKPRPQSHDIKGFPLEDMG